MAQPAFDRVNVPMTQAGLSKKRKYTEAIGGVAYTISRDCTKSRHNDRERLLAVLARPPVATALIAKNVLKPRLTALMSKAAYLAGGEVPAAVTDTTNEPLDEWAAEFWHRVEEPWRFRPDA